MNTMKALRVLLCLFSVAWPAWSLSCDDTLQHGESRELEVISVTIDGEPLEDLDIYSEHYIRITNHVDPYETDGLTRYYEFGAGIFTNSGSRLYERYPVEDSLSEIWW